ncbi:MAG: hypothetical protein RIA72_09510 [Sphingopyxis sp.]|uniref:hypothetical protein n=1 Tax=Sphingopyxis sp. TaxID=1908224 RepID=UPI0032EEEB24
MRKAIVFGLLTIGLAGCGGGDSATEAGSVDKGGAATAATASPDTVPANKFDARMYSVSEAMNTSVFGLKFDMTIDQVRAVLAEQGFAIPKDYADRGDPRVRGESLDLGLGPNADKAPGTRQKMNYNWFRMPDGVSIDTPRSQRPRETEILAPWFYVDAKGEQRLFSVHYRRGFDPSVDPRAYAGTLEKRFGEPSKISRNPQNVSAFYYIQMPIPDGYEADVDDRESFEMARQQPIKESRYFCLTAMRRDVAKSPTSECAKALAGDGAGQRLFTALNARNKGHPFSQFLEYQVLENSMTLEFRAEWLPELIQSAAAEQEVRAEIEARKARASTPAAAPKGL